MDVATLSKLTFLSFLRFLSPQLTNRPGLLPTGLESRRAQSRDVQFPRSPSHRSLTALHFATTLQLPIVLPFPLPFITARR